MAELPLLSPNSIISVYFVASIHKIVSPDPRVPLFRAMPFILWLLSGILSESSNSKCNFYRLTLTLQLFEWITEGVMLTTISGFGLFGNALSIYVLLRPSVRGTFSNILTGKICWNRSHIRQYFIPTIGNSFWILTTSNLKFKTSYQI